MEPNREDVVQMVAPLMSVVSGIDRKRKQGDAAVLSVLNVIAMKGETRPLDIAKELGVHQSTVTRHVQTLAKLGKVNVAADEGDRRSCKVSLTMSGLEELQRLGEIGISRFEKMVSGWTAEEVQTLGKLLKKLEDSRTALAASEAEPKPTPWRSKK